MNAARASHAAKQFSKSAGYKIMSVTEKDLNCQAFCTPGKFWFTKDVGEGPPPQGCLKPMLNDALRFFATWAGLFVSFWVIIMALLICTCCLYRHIPSFYDEEEGKPNQVQVVEPAETVGQSSVDQLKENN